MLPALAVNATLQQCDSTAGVVEAGTQLSCQLYLHNAPVSRRMAAASIFIGEGLGKKRCLPPSGGNPEEDTGQDMSPSSASIQSVHLAPSPYYEMR